MPAVERFPRSQKFLLGDRIQRTALDVLESLIDATYTRQRGPHLARANLGLEKLRFLFRLAHDLRYLDLRRYEHAARCLDETGRSIGAWSRTHRGAAQRGQRPAGGRRMGVTEARVEIVVAGADARGLCRAGGLWSGGRVRRRGARAGTWRGAVPRAGPPPLRREEKVMGRWLRSAFGFGSGALRLAAGAGMALLPVAVALGGECPPEEGYGYAELWWRSAGAEAVVACFTDEAAVNPPPGESGDAPAAPLFQAARFSRDPAVVAALLTAGARLVGGGRTALHVAARYNENPAVVAELARAGAGFLDQWYEDPLLVAAAFNPNPAVVGVLLEAGASVDAEDLPDRNTPLHHALRSNRSPAVALRLIEAGADVNAGNIDGHGGDTPMHYAARYSVFPAIVAALAEAGADVNTRNRRGSEPVDWYRYSDDDARLAATGETPLHHAAGYNANPALVDALVAVGADVGATGGDLLDTPLHYAAQHNPNPAVVEALVEAGADVNARNRAVNPTWIIQDHLNGVTPLHRAAAANPNPAVVEALLRAGAEVDARDAEGATPLHFAAGRSANPDVVRALVAAGADVDAEVVVPPGEVLNDLPLDYGSTPLEIAIGINRNPAVAEALVDAGAALDAEAVR